MSAFDLLAEAINDYRSDLQMCRPKSRQAPHCTVRWDVHGGTHGIEVVVEGHSVCLATGASVENAAVRALDAFRRWSEDQPAHIENALEASIETARAERAAGGRR